MTFSLLVRIKVHVKNGEKIHVFDLELEDFDTIGNVKFTIEDKLHIKLEQKKLLFDGKILADKSTLSDHNITDGSTLLCVDYHRDK